MPYPAGLRTSYPAGGAANVVSGRVEGIVTGGAEELKGRSGLCDLSRPNEPTVFVAVR